MASCHTRLERHAASNAGPATAELRHEHAVILRGLVLLERAAERLAGGLPVDEAMLQELARFLQTFADRCHHGKEEATLFPVLSDKGLGGTLRVFLEEHDEGRGYLRTLTGGGSAAERAKAARRYVGMLRDHIQREDEVLFPMADNVLSLDEHDALARRYADIERDVMGAGAHERLLATLDAIEAAMPAGSPPDAAERAGRP